MEERLQQMRATLSTGGVLSKADKQWIRDNYRALSGHDLKTKKGCNSCWMDGIVYMISKTKTGLKMVSGGVITYKGKVYNKHTITEEIIKAVYDEHKHLFY